MQGMTIARSGHPAPPKGATAADYVIALRTEAALIRSVLAKDQALSISIAFGGGILPVRSIGILNEHFLKIDALEDESVRRIIAPLAQVSIMFSVVQQKPGEEPRAIGFHAELTKSPPLK